MSKLVGLDFEVFGRVQGVFFRKVSEFTRAAKDRFYEGYDAVQRDIKVDTKLDHKNFNFLGPISSYLFYLLSFKYKLVFATRDGAVDRFIWYTQKQGEELGLKGWCMNTKDGTVVGRIEGEKSKIDDMKQWLQKTGSPQSHIDKAEFRNEKEISELNFANFSIKK